MSAAPPIKSSPKTGVQGLSQYFQSNQGKAIAVALVVIAAVASLFLLQSQYQFLSVVVFPLLTHPVVVIVVTVSILVAIGLYLYRNPPTKAPDLSDKDTDRSMDDSTESTDSDSFATKTATATKPLQSTTTTRVKEKETNSTKPTSGGIYPTVTRQLPRSNPDQGHGKASSSVATSTTRKVEQPPVEAPVKKGASTTTKPVSTAQSVAPSKKESGPVKARNPENYIFNEEKKMRRRSEIIKNLDPILECCVNFNKHYDTISDPIQRAEYKDPQFEGSTNGEKTLSHMLRRLFPDAGNANDLHAFGIELENNKDIQIAYASLYIEYTKLLRRQINDFKWLIENDPKGEKCPRGAGSRRTFSSNIEDEIARIEKFEKLIFKKNEKK